MPTFTSATKVELQRLLELFPVSKLRETWNQIEGTKEQLCAEVSLVAKRKEILSFVLDNLGCCKQHVYIFNTPKPKIPIPTDLLGSGNSIEGDSGLYLVRVSFKVVLSDPLEDAQVDFLWPVYLQDLHGHRVVRIVLLEKDVKAHFERTCVVRPGSLNESDILQNLRPVCGPRSDLHKGIKSLWSGGFIDATRVRYKKSTSQAWEAMNNLKGVRKTDPELYKLVMNGPILNTLFLGEKDWPVEVHSIDPSEGFIAFPRYSEESKDTEYVVREILTRN